MFKTFQNLLLLSLLFLTISCGKEKLKYLTNGPFYLKGLKQVNAENFKGAEKSFLKDISFEKSYAAHLQLIFIYEELKQYPQLLFHCDEYLRKAQKNDSKISLIEGYKSDGKESYYLRLNGLLGQKKSKEFTSREKLFRKSMLDARREQVRLEHQLHQYKVSGKAAAPQKVYAPIKETSKLVKPASTTKVPMKTYIVKKGDSLSKISKTVYGSARHWKKIQAANLPELANPSNIKVGQAIRTPTLK